MPLRWRGTTTLGGFVDPSATDLRVLDAEGKEQTRAEVVDGAVVLVIDPRTASQLVLEREDELLAALSVPLLRPPRPAPPTPGSGTVTGEGAGEVRALLGRIAGDPGAPRDLAHPAAPPGLVDGLHRLLVRTPRVSAIRGGAGSYIVAMEGPPGCEDTSDPAWCEATLFLLLVPVGGELRLIGYDYRPIR